PVAVHQRISRRARDPDPRGLGTRESSVDLLDRVALRSGGAFHCLSDGLRHVQHEVAIRLRIVGSLRLERAHRRSERLDRLGLDLLWRRRYAEAGAPYLGHLADQWVRAVASRLGQMLGEGTNLLESVEEAGIGE